LLRIGNPRFQCEVCGKSYGHKQSLNSHLCTDRVPVVEMVPRRELEIIEARHEKEKEDLRKQIESLLEKVGNVNIENQMNNIQINYYGCENMEYITDKFIQEMMKIPYKSIPRIIRQVHFHPAHPENHNVKITNKKLPYASVFRDNKWELENKKNVIEDLMRKGYGVLDEKHENTTHLSETRKSRYSVFQDKFQEEEPETIKQIYQDTELILLNG